MGEHKLEGDQICMRIYVGEADKYKGKPLYKAIIDLLRQEGIAGVTVYRAIAGYGPSSIFRTTSLLRLSVDLPIIIEVVEDPLKIDAILPKLDEMVTAGMITLQKVHVLVYRAKGNKST
jgi:PII-like signaling protein